MVGCAEGQKQTAEEDFDWGTSGVKGGSRLNQQ